jgi:hypothetical protein
MKPQPQPDEARSFRSPRLEHVPVGDGLGARPAGGTHEGSSCSRVRRLHGAQHCSRPLARAAERVAAQADASRNGHSAPWPWAVPARRRLAAGRGPLSRWASRISSRRLRQRTRSPPTAPREPAGTSCRAASPAPLRARSASPHMPAATGRSRRTARGGPCGRASRNAPGRPAAQAKLIHASTENTVLCSQRQPRTAARRAYSLNSSARQQRGRKQHEARRDEAEGEPFEREQRHAGLRLGGEADLFFSCVMSQACSTAAANNP